MKSFTAPGRVTAAGFVTWSSPDSVRSILQNLFGDKPVDITVSVRGKKRSVQANAFYWVMVTLISEHTGYSKRQVHQMLKSMFLAETVWLADKDGNQFQQVTVVPESKTLSKSEFSGFIENVIRLCDDLGIILPEYSGDKYAGNLGD